MSTPEYCLSMSCDALNASIDRANKAEARTTHRGNMGPWIKCSAQLPPETSPGIGEHVLCHTQTGMMVVGWRIYGRWYLGDRYADENGYEVQCWMPLPGLPIA